MVGGVGLQLNSFIQLNKYVDSNFTQSDFNFTAFTTGDSGIGIDLQF